MKTIHEKLIHATSCTIPATHPARAHVPPLETDVQRTFNEHTPVAAICDDYDNCDRLGYLETMGAFNEH